MRGKHRVAGLALTVTVFAAFAAKAQITPPLPLPKLEMGTASVVELVSAAADCISIAEPDGRFSEQKLKKLGWLQNGLPHPVVPEPSPAALATSFRRANVYLSIIRGPNADLCMPKAHVDDANALTDVRSLLISSLGAKSFDDHSGHIDFKDRLRNQLGLNQKNNFLFLKDFVLLLQSTMFDGTRVTAVQVAPIRI